MCPFMFDRLIKKIIHIHCMTGVQHALTRGQKVKFKVTEISTANSSVYSQYQEGSSRVRMSIVDIIFRVSRTCFYVISG